MFETSLDPLRLALAASSLALAILAITSGLRARRPARALAGGAVLAGVLWWIYFATFPTAVGSRGDAEIAALVVSYVSMVLGMTAHYVYAKAEKGETTLRIEWMPFLMPILASPIVFIPLVSIAGEVGTDGGLFSRARLMVYLVAFQNGFFWKHFFDQRRPALPTPPVLHSGNRPVPGV
jgi:hypothetical protein